MEELDELRQAIEAGDYDQALAILDELDAMSRDDKITKVMSYMRVFLVHLIKQVAEQRSTRSWEDSADRKFKRHFCAAPPAPPHPRRWRAAPPQPAGAACSPATRGGARAGQVPLLKG